MPKNKLTYLYTRYFTLVIKVAVMFLVLIYFYFSQCSEKSSFVNPFTLKWKQAQTRPVAVHAASGRGRHSCNRRLDQLSRMIATDTKQGR